MQLKSRIVTYRFGLVVAAFVGLYLNSGLPQTFQPTMFLYYTILSNLICLVYFSSVLFKNIKNYRDWDVRDPHQNVIQPRFKGGITLCITVTFLVYHFLLAPLIPVGDTTYGNNLASNLTHYIVPIMVIVDWLLFDIKGIFKKEDPFIWLSIPFAYLMLSFTYGAIGTPFRFLPKLETYSKYAYWFLDIDQLGLMQVATNSIMLAIAFAILGYIIFGLDRLLKRLKTQS